MSLEEKILNRLIDKYERSKLYLSGSSNQKSIFILTSKEGYSHACDVSAYSFVLVSRMAKKITKF